MTDDDRNALLNFVSTTRQDLDSAFRLLDDHDPRRLAENAWSEINASGEFQSVIRAIEGRDHEPRLDAFGLSGAQLAFKLAVVDQARSRLLAAQQATDDEDSEPEHTPEPAEAAIRPRRLRWIRALLAKLLGAINVVLDTLVAALAGVGEAIKEFKQGLEKLLEE